jgi:hypothetical protein
MTIRQEIHNCIEDISESKLIVLKPLLFALAEESIVIENNLTDEERILFAQGMAEYEKNPDSFISLENVN